MGYTQSIHRVVNKGRAGNQLIILILIKSVFLCATHERHALYAYINKHVQVSLALPANSIQRAPGVNW